MLYLEQLDRDCDCVNDGSVAAWVDERMREIDREHWRECAAIKIKGSMDERISEMEQEGLGLNEQIANIARFNPVYEKLMGQLKEICMAIAPLTPETKAIIEGRLTGEEAFRYAFEAFENLFINLIKGGEKYDYDDIDRFIEGAHFRILLSDKRWHCKPAGLYDTCWLASLRDAAKPGFFDIYLQATTVKKYKGVDFGEGYHVEYDRKINGVGFKLNIGNGGGNWRVSARFRECDLSLKEDVAWVGVMDLKDDRYTDYKFKKIKNITVGGACFEASLHSVETFFDGPKITISVAYSHGKDGGLIFVNETHEADYYNKKVREMEVGISYFNVVLTTYMTRIYPGNKRR